MKKEDPEAADHTPCPPAGYTSWLDYALDCIDMRSIEIESLFNGGPAIDRDAIRSAARQELDNLREKAARLEILLGGSSVSVCAHKVDGGN